MIVLTWCGSPMKWSHMVWKICPQQSGNEWVGPDEWSFTLGYQTFACYPLKYLHMERTCTPCPKILSRIHILRKWKVKLEDLEVLTPYTSYKGRAYIYGIFVSFISIYNFLTFTLFGVIGIHPITDLIFRESLVGTPPIVSVGFSLFVLWVPLITIIVYDGITNNFVNHQSWTRNFFSI